jgi:hypothetical protein
MRIMKFERWSKYLSLRESVKDDELNRILDKISSHQKLSDREEQFLAKFDQVVDTDLSDMSHLSKNTAFDKVSNLLERGKKVICDLYDKDGQINDQIISVENDFESETCILNLKHGDEAELNDRFLYTINYDFGHDTYSLRSQDEFFEKLPVKSDED